MENVFPREYFPCVGIFEGRGGVEAIFFEVRYELSEDLNAFRVGFAVVKIIKKFRVGCISEFFEESF